MSEAGSGTAVDPVSLGCPKATLSRTTESPDLLKASDRMSWSEVKPTNANFGRPGDANVSMPPPARAIVMSPEKNDERSAPKAVTPGASVTTSADATKPLSFR